jgi:THH1/TOM1/TOM3 domain
MSLSSVISAALDTTPPHDNSETSAEYVTDATLSVLYAVVLIVTGVVWHRAKSAANNIPYIKRVFWTTLAAFAILRMVWFGIPDSEFASSYRPVNHIDSSPLESGSWKSNIGQFAEYFLKSAADVLFFCAYCLIVYFWATTFYIFWRQRHGVEASDNEHIAPSSGTFLTRPRAFRSFMIVVGTIIVLQIVLWCVYWFVTYYVLLIASTVLGLLISLGAIFGFVFYGMALMNSLEPLVDASLHAQPSLIPNARDFMSGSLRHERRDRNGRLRSGSAVNTGMDGDTCAALSAPQPMPLEHTNSPSRHDDDLDYRLSAPYGSSDPDVETASSQPRFHRGRAYSAPRVEAPLEPRGYKGPVTSSPQPVPQDRVLNSIVQAAVTSPSDSAEHTMSGSNTGYSWVGIHNHIEPPMFDDHSVDNNDNDDDDGDGDDDGNRGDAGINMPSPPVTSASVFRTPKPEETGLDIYQIATHRMQQAAAERVRSKMRKIRAVTVACTLGFAVKFVMGAYELYLIIQDLGHSSQTAASGTQTTFPEHWYILLAVYYLFGEIMVSIAVVIVLRHSTHSDDATDDEVSTTEDYSYRYNRLEE